MAASAEEGGDCGADESAEVATRAAEQVVRPLATRI